MSVDAMDFDKRTALMLAASEGNLAIVKMLLAAGANPMHVDRCVNPKP